MKQSLAEIEALYAAQEQGEASLDCMLGLVRFIGTLRRDDLRCWTLMPDLYIASDDADVNPDAGPYLMIAPLFNGQVILRYVDAAHPEAEWRKIFKPEHAQVRLLVALDQLSQSALA